MPDPVEQAWSGFTSTIFSQNETAKKFNPHINKTVDYSLENIWQFSTEV
jgi:hypothetical protein